MAAGGVAGAAPQHQPLSPQNAQSLLDSVEAFLFDCDGVIWKGDKLIAGVPDALRSLRCRGKKLVFVTNNSRKSRKQYANKFRKLGLDVNEDEIFSSSFAAAMFLKKNEFPRDKKVYVIGEEGIMEELELAGFTCLGGPEDGKKSIQLKSNYRFEHDKSVGAVVVGLDQYINYYKLQYATLCIRENPECLFIATNRDAVGHLTDSQEWPGSGCMVAAVCGSTEREPIVVGKPSTFMMEFLLQSSVLVMLRLFNPVAEILRSTLGGDAHYIQLSCWRVATSLEERMEGSREGDEIFLTFLDGRLF